MPARRQARTTTARTRPDGGGTVTPVDTTSLRALLDGADTLTATSFHCLAAAGAGCEGSPPVTAGDDDA